MTKFYSLRNGLLLAFSILSSIGISQTYTFTTATATGNIGPTQVMVDAEYAATNLAGAVTCTGGIQYWDVPSTGVYIIDTYGGQGYGSFGGRGAHMSGEFILTAGTTLKILVGQEAGHYFDWPNTGYNNQYGGGGGSFVTYTNNTALIIAGGGGGSHATNYITQCDAQITQNGAAGINASLIGAGGTNGMGGLQATSADGGGGLLGNGDGIAGGQAFVNGGLGGIDEGTGGFGCGGGTSSWNNYRGGGGGGYSGGGGANNAGTCCPSAGGGGSYNNGSNPVNVAGVQIGDGIIIITVACNPTAGTLVADAASLPDILEDCVVNSATPPTASNNCVSGLAGSPDVTFPVTTVGTTIITWTYDDGTNTITQTQNIIISGIDATAPVADIPNLLNLGGQCDFTAPIPTATDMCAGSISGVPDVTFPLNTQGLTVITWTYDDGNGNVSTQTQNITLNDVAAPAPDVTALPDYTGCDDATPPTATATDYCAGSINGTPDVSFPITAPGPTTVTWTYDDGNGNTVSQTQDVYVVTIDNGATLTGTTISADDSNLTYQWIDCATGQAISGETNQSYTPTVTGNYAVQVENGNCTDTSACILVDFTGIDALDNNAINIYPNPINDGNFSVDCDGVIDQILVVDGLGRTISLPTDVLTGKVDGSALAAGKYTVRVITNNMVYTKQIVIIR